MQNKSMIKGSKASRLFYLFNTPGRENGRRRLAVELGVDHVVLWRWAAKVRKGARGLGGNIPMEYNLRILEAGDKLGVSRELIAPLLEPNICPTCHRPYPAGRIF